MSKTVLLLASAALAFLFFIGYYWQHSYSAPGEPRQT